MIYRRPGFLAVVYDLAPLPPLSPIPTYARPATHRKTEKEKHLLTGERKVGGGEETKYTTARKPGPLKIIQYSLDSSDYF